MAPVEFEKHIKEKMEERRIEPSSNAWDKISTRIEGQRIKRKPFYYRYAVAALIVGVLLTSIWVYRQSDIQEPVSQPVVNTPVISPEQVEDEVLPETYTDIEGLAVDEEQALPDDIQLARPEALEETALADESQEADIGSVAVAETTLELKTDPLLDDKVNEVLSQVMIMEEDKIVVTDAEVDSLLRNAQRELITNNQFTDQYGVNAADLLAGVEEELDQSFRDQVFEKLKQGFVKVRTAVADRNK